MKKKPSRPAIIQYISCICKKKTNKILIETCQKTLSKPSSHILALKIYSIAPSSNSYNVLSGHSLVRLSNK